ncbi:MAG: AAA domain-containing protein [Bacteroidota bacterium]
MSKTVQAELEKLQELLELEKQEDLEQFKQKVLQLPLEERKKQGFTWYPLEITKQGYTYGERAYIIAQRTTQLGEPHRLRSGQAANLFTLQPSVKGREKSGVIHYVDRNKIKIILNTKDLPTWLGLGMVGVDMLFDETTYIEMAKALKKVMSAKQDRLAELREILYGQQEPAFYPTNQAVNIPSLNPSQNKAVNQVLASRDITIIHGPPGTGKTTTIVQAVKQLCKTESTVLVTAPSNTAVDLLTERIASAGLQVVRIGNISRVDEDVINHTLDMQISAHPESKNIKKVKIQAAEMRRQAKRFKRRFGRDEYINRGNLFREAGQLDAWANQLEDRLIDQILSSAQVITCTLVGASSKILNNRKFRTAVIDEAAQGLEPATWIPILKASKVVLTGDPFQLPPTVKSNEAQRKGFGITLIEKSIKRNTSANLLNIQYRMHETIMGFSNQRFYDGQLQAAEAVKQHQLAIAKNAPLVFIDTAGCGFAEQIQQQYKSRYNPDEYQILREHLYLLRAAVQEEELPSIALISPYREQVALMKQSVKEDVQLADLTLSINTIDGFQGQEADVVYISLVRSNDKGEIGFLKDYRRMNVAMTRAKKQLVVIGDSATIGVDAFYQAFLDYCEQEGLYQTAWEYMQGAV